MATLHLGQESFLTDGIDGKVGVGTASPQYLLDISGGDARVVGPSWSYLYDLSRLYFGSGQSGVASEWGIGLKLCVYKPSGGGVLDTNSMDAITILDGGNVGIGTTAPTVLLDVNGAGKFSGQLDMNSHKVVNVTDPTSAQDAATKNYVDTQGASSGGGWTRYGANNTIYCSNTADSVCIGTTTLVAGTRLTVSGKIQSGSLNLADSNPTIYCSGTGSLAITCGTTLSISSSGVTSGAKFTVSSGGLSVIGATTLQGNLNVQSGNFTCGGTKSFKIPHPDPKKTGKMLVHSCLEGPENAVYYRGKAKLKSGIIKINLPDYFIYLADEKSATVKLTCFNNWSPIYVESLKNGVLTIKIDNSQNEHEFYWEVTAKRIDLPDLDVEVEA